MPGPPRPRFLLHGPSPAYPDHHHPINLPPTYLARLACTYSGTARRHTAGVPPVLPLSSERTLHNEVHFSHNRVLAVSRMCANEPLLRGAGPSSCFYSYTVARTWSVSLTYISHRAPTATGDSRSQHTRTQERRGRAAAHCFCRINSAQWEHKHSTTALLLVRIARGTYHVEPTRPGHGPHCLAQMSSVR